MNRQWSVQTRYFVLALVLILLAALGWYARAMIQPLIIAGLLAYLLNPAVSWLKRWRRWSHKTAVNIVYFVSLAILLSIPATVVPVLLNQTQTLTLDLEDFPSRLQTFVSQPILILGYQFSLSHYLPGLGQSLSSWMAPLPGTALHILETTSRNVLWIILIVVTVYYLLMDWEILREWLIRIWPQPYRKDARRLFLEIKSIWAAYLRGQLALMFILGVIYTFAWLVIGLPGALILGVLTGLLNIVPELGPFIAAMLAVIVALVEGSYFLPLSNVWFGVLTIGLYLVLNYIKTIWIQPRVLGYNVHMHEGLVFMAIVIAILVQGVLLVLIIVPVLASAMVIGRYLRDRILGQPPFHDQDQEEVLALEIETGKESPKRKPVHHQGEE
jgi:predicted PurR-regulated permease PerM